MDALQTRPAVAIFVILLVTACGAGRSDTAAPEPAERSPADSETARLEALYEARRDSARMRFVDADVAFMNGMIAHHAQAILVSRLAPDRGASPSIRTLAARIINAQRDEIALMQQWLRDRGLAVPEVHIDGLQLMVHGAGPGHDMRAPGMLTDEQIRRLDRARGEEFDRLFLTYMIEHHNGAVAMVHALFDQDAAGQGVAIFELASDIQVDQATEIARMRQMLDDMTPDEETPQADGPASTGHHTIHTSTRQP